MKLILAMLALLLVVGCSGKQLKKVVGDLPADYMYCPEQVDGDFRICETPSQIYRVVDPK